jgi:hypothetical protein
MRSSYPFLRVVLLVSKQHTAMLFVDQTIAHD